MFLFNLCIHLFLIRRLRRNHRRRLRESRSCIGRIWPDESIDFAGRRRHASFGRCYFSDATRVTAYDQRRSQALKSVLDEVQDCVCIRPITTDGRTGELTRVVKDAWTIPKMPVRTTSAIGAHFKSSKVKSGQIKAEFFNLA